jgi:hypothetical protein
MLGWIAARLNWRVSSAFSGESGEAEFMTAEGTLLVRVEQRQNGASGLLLSVELEAEDVSFHVRCGDGEGRTLASGITCGGEEAGMGAYQPLKKSTADLLVDALEVRTNITDWEDALRVIRNLTNE